MIKVLAGLVSPEASLLGLQMPLAVSSHGLSLCVLPGSEDALGRGLSSHSFHSVSPESGLVQFSVT